MKTEDRQRLNRARAREKNYLHFRSGLRELVKNNRWKITFLVAYFLAAIVIWQNKKLLLFGPTNTFPLYSAMQTVLNVSVIILTLFGLVWLIVRIGIPAHARKIQDGLLRVGFVNAAQEPPCRFPCTMIKDFPLCLMRSMSLI